MYSGNFLDPSLPFPVLKVHDLGVGPMEVIGDEGYLLVQPVEGVARYSPTGSSSTSNWCSHLGQMAVMLPVPSSLILW